MNDEQMDWIITDRWGHDVGEGPWSSRELASEFLEAEVGAPGAMVVPQVFPIKVRISAGTRERWQQDEWAAWEDDGGPGWSDRRMSEPEELEGEPRSSWVVPILERFKSQVEVRSVAEARALLVSGRYWQDAWGFDGWTPQYGGALRRICDRIQEALTRATGEEGVNNSHRPWRQVLVLVSDRLTSTEAAEAVRRLDKGGTGLRADRQRISATALHPEPGAHGFAVFVKDPRDAQAARELLADEGWPVVSP